LKKKHKYQNKKKNETKQREKKQIKNLTYKKMKVAKLTNSDLINGGNILR
jgi:hypothetical protein